MKPNNNIDVHIIFGLFF